MNWSKEHKFEIWHDKTGERFEIGNDRDGLDCMEIRYISDDGITRKGLIFPPEIIPLLIDSIIEWQSTQKKPETK